MFFANRCMGPDVYTRNSLSSGWGRLPHRSRCNLRVVFFDMLLKLFCKKKFSSKMRLFLVKFKKLEGAVPTALYNSRGMELHGLSVGTNRAPNGNYNA